MQGRLANADIPGVIRTDYGYEWAGNRTSPTTVYNAWGKVVSSSGSTVNPYRYVGRYGYYYDTETNLYLLGKRYYDADAGVFCQRDPAKDGLSWYAYTRGQVTKKVDPWGTEVEDEDGCDITFYQCRIAAFDDFSLGAVKCLRAVAGIPLSNAKKLVPQLFKMACRSRWLAGALARISIVGDIASLAALATCLYAEFTGYKVETEICACTRDRCKYKASGDEDAYRRTHDPRYRFKPSSECNP